MSLTEDQITAQNFKDFFNIIKPYLNNTTNMGFTPVGTIIAVMGKTAPNNYLSCEGQIVNISDYPELASYFTRQFEQVDYFGGDGVSTFGIPDLRGEFLRGTGTNSHTADSGTVQGSGANVGVHQDATEVPSVWSNATNLNTALVGTRYSDSYRDIGKYKGNTNTATSNTGFYALTVRPTNTSVLYCIAYKNIYVTHTVIDERNKYSTEEKIIGEWIDGKPLYQIVIQSTGTWQGEQYDVNIATIPNFETMLIKIINGYALTGKDGTSCGVNMNYAHPKTIEWGNAFWVDDNGGIIRLCLGRYQTIKNPVFIIQYTKTTD